MTITTNFDIFVANYKKNNPPRKSILSKLPNDLIISCLKKNRYDRRNEIWKRKHDLVVAHLNMYFENMEDEFGGDLDEEGINPNLYNIDYVFKEGMLRWDTYFLDNNFNQVWKPRNREEEIENMWWNRYNGIIVDKHFDGDEEEYEEWLENYY